MKSPRKAVIATVAIGAVLAALTGCSPAAAPDGKITITVASLIPGSSKDAFAAFYARVQQFEKAHKNITLKPVEYQWTGPTFASQLAGGTLPDVFNVPFTDSQSLLQAGQLADITADVKKLPYASKFNQNLLQVASKDGKIYGIPYGPYGYGISYNRALFTKAGLDPNKPPTTWDEVRADAKIISDKLHIAGFMQFTSGNTGGWALTAETYSRGGRMETVSGGKTTVTTDNPQTIASLQYLHDLRWVDNSVGSNFLLDWSGMNQYFGAGQTAMYPSGSDVLTSLVQQNNVDPKDYGLTVLPTEGADSGILAGGNVATVNVKASAEEKAAAVQWIDFYYMQKLTNQAQSVADAKILVGAKQPVGVPQLPIFDQKTLDTSLGWIDQYINVPKANVAPFQDGVFKLTIVPEPARHTQELYAALDSVVQAVLTDKNADITALLQGVNKKVQALVDADTY
ncbi:MAG: extracellular solute-binding protein [Glaciihabitans sp.]|nr:extracellular solute-binding protein [Glaciihabitans sp.]MCU1535155.1 extracellular solute-binding protein [Glaciihabitans sp.]MDQ1556927.1 multiple sugar transport system substrate-binding protein [Actinomycetota bacterium]